MSFYTGLMFYRPTKPPIVTGQSLAEFVRAFRDLRVSEAKGLFNVEVKFGTAIDQDDKPSSWEEAIGHLISEFREIEWDVKEQPESLTGVARVLASHKKPIYRAYLGFGAATPEIIDALKRVPSPENEMPLGLDSWSLQIDRIESCALDSGALYFVGWMSVGISGYGYLFPWTFAELVHRAEQQQGIRKVMELCRSTWPVQPGRPNQRVQELRQQASEIWPYPEFDLPWDWYWGLGETG